MKKTLLSLTFIIFMQIMNATNTIDYSSLEVNLKVIEITDTTLDQIYYNNSSFDEPTKLIFTNLTAVTGSIYFSNYTNLVSVEFPNLESVTGDTDMGSLSSFSFHQNNSLENVLAPKLKSVDGHVYFHQNTALKTINLNALETIYSYIYVYGNSVLELLEVCNLKEILPADEFDEPYYSISNNNQTVDNNQPCWGSNPPTDIFLSNNSITENEAIDTMIGNLSATPSNQNFTYFFDQNDLVNEEYGNDFFKIIDNQLVSNSSFDFEDKNQYLIKISVRNDYGEKTGKEFTVNINDIKYENLTTIEVTDTTLNEINYDTGFNEPTRLVFTNLKTVNGNISFYGNSNLVVVEFPLLENSEGNFSFHQNNSVEVIKAPLLKSVSGFVYFHENKSLETISLSTLETIYSYIYVYGNTSLESLEVCNLKEILPLDEFDEPYYSISNNTQTIDDNQPCWGSSPPTDLFLSNNSINENENIDTIIGGLSATPSNQNFTYFFDLNDLFNDQGEEYDNNFFKIVGNQLVTNYSFDFEAKNQYLIKISVRNSFGEKTSKEFIININDVQNEILTVIEITDTILDGLSYYNTSFVGPTKLVFTNLTEINGDVYLDNTINLKKIAFPALTKVNGYVYLNNNYSLTIGDFPFLETIKDYIYTSNNNILSELNICSLSEIIQSQSGIDPYYYIKNNFQLNYDTTCLTNTVIVINYLDNIIEENGELLVAIFSSNAGSNFNISYFFVDNEGNETTNEDFKIIENKLYLTKEFDYYNGKEFSLRVGAIRYENSESNRSTQIKKSETNSLNEKIEEQFTLNMSGVVLGLNDLFNNKELLSLYPNPSLEEVIINGIENYKVREIEIININGQRIKKLKINDNVIKLNGLKAGIYYLLIKTEKKLFSKKLIKL